MKFNQLRLGSLVATLLLTLPTIAYGRGIRVGPPLQRGHARPPLQVNVKPATSVYYTPPEIRHAYGFDQLAANGTGQTIAIVDAYGNPEIQSDMDTFCQGASPGYDFGYSLNSCTVDIVNNYNPGGDTGWGLETALDVEWAHAIAPNATILLSVAKSASDNDLLDAVDAAVQAGATVVSMSWGGPESSGVKAYDSHFKNIVNPNGQSVTFVASSGDNAEDVGYGVQCEWPAVSPYVLSVGGTTLTLDPSDNRSVETAWSDSGGGLSQVYSTPLWQGGWSPWLTSRGVPDVSYVADPNTGVVVYDAYNGGWYIVGGTSVGAPQWAALIALVNQERVDAGASALSGADAAIYAADNAHNPVSEGPNANYYAIASANSYDVTSGTNGGHHPDTDDYAVAGYDLVTGLGTPNAVGLLQALEPTSTTFGTIKGSVTDSASSAISGASVSTDSGQSATTASDGTYTIQNVPTGTRTVTASASGYASQSQSVTVSENTTTIADFKLDGVGSIAGTVTDSTGSPISGATVSTGSGLSTVTASDGTYTIQNVPVGSYTVTASASGYTTASQNVSVSQGQPATADFTLAQTLGSITGTVTDSTTGSPISGATVSTDSSQSATTDSNGIYTIQNVPTGTRTVTASASGYSSQSQSVDVTENNTTTGVNFSLSPSGGHGHGHKNH